MLYFLFIDNQTRGPFSEEEIRTRLKAGTLHSTVLVCEEGGEQWKPVNEWFGNLEYKLPPVPKVVAAPPKNPNLDKLNHKLQFGGIFLSKFPRPLAIVYESGVKSALRFATPAAAIGGFVSDVLQPIGPFSLYLFILSIVSVLVSGSFAWALRQRIESGLRRKSSLICSFTTVCSIVFGTTWFFFTSSCPDKGFLASRVDAIESIQESLLGVQHSVGRIESTVTQVSTDVDVIKSNVKDISKGVSELGKMGGIITNPTTPIELYNNALIFKERGDVGSQRKALEAFVKTGEQKIEPYTMLVEVLKGMEGPEGARRAYAGLIKDNPTNLMLRTYLFKLLPRGESVTHLRSVIEQNQDFTPAYFAILGGGQGYACSGFLLADTREELEELFSGVTDRVHKILPLWESSSLFQKYVDTGTVGSITCAKSEIDFYKNDRTQALEKVITEIDAQKTEALENNGLPEIYTTYQELSQKRPLPLFLYDSTNGLYYDHLSEEQKMIVRALSNINERILEFTQENNELNQQAERRHTEAINRAERESARKSARSNKLKSKI
jgi:hypothetical protein